RDRLRGGGGAAPSRRGPLAARPAEPPRRLGLDGGGRRLERHGRRGRSAPRRRRPGPPDSACARIPAPLPQPRRRLRADPRARLGRAVHGVGNPGLPLRPASGAPRRLRLPQTAPASRRQLRLLGPLHDHACLGDGAGAAGLGPEVLPFALETVRMAAAAILTIGNELLSGDVENSNGTWLARRLEAAGADVRLI